MTTKTQNTPDSLSAVLEAYRSEDLFADLRTAFEDAKNAVKPLKEEAESACTAYLDDLLQEKENLTAAAEDYDRQLTETDSRLDDLSARLVSAAGKRDEAACKVLREQIAAEEGVRASLLRQKDFLASAAVRGDEELYRKAEAAETALENAVEELIRSLEPVFDLLNDKHEKIDKMKKSLVIRTQALSGRWIYNDSSFDNGDLWERVQKRHATLNKPAPAAAFGSRFTVSQTLPESEMDSPGISQKWLN